VKSEKKRKIFTVLRTVKINNFSSLFSLPSSLFKEFS